MNTDHAAFTSLQELGLWSSHPGVFLEFCYYWGLNVK